MAKRSTKYEYRGYNSDIKPGESEEAYFKRVMAAADKRLQRLEYLSKEPGYEGVLNYAYKTAMRDIEIYKGEGRKRFGQTVPTDRRDMNEQISAALHFLESATSTREGIKKIYTERAKTLSEQMGIDIRWDEVADVVDAMSSTESGGSPTKLKAIGVIKSIDKYGFEKALKKNRHMKDDIVMKVAKDYLKGDKFASLRDSLDIDDKRQKELLEDIRSAELM